MRLTLEGQAIVEDAQRVLAKVEALQLRARNYKVGVETRLTIAFDTIFPRETLVASLAKVHALYPTVAVRIVSLAPSDPIQLVESGEVDLGIGLLPRPPTRTLNLDRLGFVRLFMVASSAHPLAQLRGGFADSELLDYTQTHVTDAMRILGIDTSKVPPSAWRVIDLDVNRQLILAGIGWGLLPEHAIIDDLRRKRLVVSIPKSRRPNGATPTAIAAISRADRNQGPVLKMLIDDLRRRSRKSGAPLMG